MMTSFGFNDAGGGTTVPRLAAKELARRGWDVSVFHAAVQPTESRVPYELSETEQDGVRLIGVHNRPSALFDFDHPLREIGDPPVTAAFAGALDRLRPDVVHFHNLHNLGAELIDQAQVRGIPSYFTTHNYWLICPRAYLLDDQLGLCPSPGDGSRCSSCCHGTDSLAYRRRLAVFRAHASTGLDRILAVSDAVRETLVANGYPPELVDVVRQAMPHETEIWNQLGRDRKPGRVGASLTVAFVGSAYAHKGPQLLVEAAQLTDATIRVLIIGEVQPQFARQLMQLDHRGVVELSGGFAPTELPGLLGTADAAVLPSMWWDCAPLAAAECKAARLPLLVPKLGGLPETISDEVDGLSFDGLDARDLARQLQRLATETGLLERLQTAIEPPASFSDYIDELEAYYHGERSGPQLSPPVERRAAAVRWQGQHGQPNSLSIVNDAICSRLDLPVERVSPDRRRVGPPAPYASSVEVHHQWPPDLSAPASGALAAIVPWEFGSVPAAWVEQIQEHVDELWVPSDFVRSMYVADGVDESMVVTIPNGVDLDHFHPSAADAVQTDGPVRFLFVGGLISRKGPDLLLRAWLEAFAERDDVVLQVKDFGAAGIYSNGDRGPIQAHAQSGALPRIELVDSELDSDQMAALYQSADVLVHPYRAEGFAMPVLEAMACGLPVIVTAGGPTDEFCPPEAGWRISSEHCPLPARSLPGFETVHEPWILEPNLAELVDALRTAADDPAQRRRRGAIGRETAKQYSWDAVAERYAERIRALAQRKSKLHHPPFRQYPFRDTEGRRALATPAWRGQDALAELLGAWSEFTTPDSGDCLYLLADPEISGTPAEIEQTVIGAAQRGGADLDSCADVDILMESFSSTRDEAMLAGVDLYIPLHAGCAGYARLASQVGCPVLTAGSDDLPLLLGAPARAADSPSR